MMECSSIAPYIRARGHAIEGPISLGCSQVVDRPETKEGVGGYSVVRVAGRAEAIDLAKRFPHATWEPVEVREIAYLDRT